MPDGQPDARYVLVRGVDERGFVFHTNYASPKSRQLDANPRPPACSRGSTSIARSASAGAMSRVDAAESDAYFDSRPRDSQVGAWASPQSDVLADRADLDRRIAEIDARFEGGAVPRPDFWGGWRLGSTRSSSGRAARAASTTVSVPPDARRLWAVERLAP